MISTTSTPTWTGMVPVDDTALAVTDSGGSGTPELERDAWIMLAAQIPDIDAVIAEKHRQLDEDPDMTRLYRLLSSVSEWSPDDPRVVELADIIEQLRIRGIESGEVEIGDADASDPFAVCSTRPWPSPRRSPDGSWRSSSNVGGVGGVAGRGSNESPKGAADHLRLLLPRSDRIATFRVAQRWNMAPRKPAD